MFTVTAHTAPLAGMCSSLLEVHLRPLIAFVRYPAERLSRVQALKGMTLDAAYASFEEARLGSLTPGKKADYVVFDRDFVNDSTPADQILRTKVHATVIDGRVAYGGL